MLVVPLLSVVLADTRDLPDGRSQAGDRHLKIHDERDNLEPPFYFLLGDRTSILTTLAAAGFPVEWEERAYSPS
jgi:hypothetical protein